MDDVSDDFEVDVTKEDAAVSVVRVRGEIDVVSAPQLGTAIDATLANAPSALVIDLSQVPFMDSSGIAVLIRATRHVEVRLRDPSPATRRVIEASGLGEHFGMDGS